jgi:hypothetical protein
MYIFSCSMSNSPSMEILHDHIDFGLQIPFLGSKGFFSPFCPPKYSFFLAQSSRSMDISDYNIGFGLQDPFLGSEGLLLTFWALKKCPGIFRNFTKILVISRIFKNNSFRNFQGFLRIFGSLRIFKSFFKRVNCKATPDQIPYRLGFPKNDR